MYLAGATYSRNDIYSLLNLSEDRRGGDWLNGYHRHDSDCNVGVAGRTGHNYDNHWEGERLVWHGKTNSHFGQNAIQNLVSGEYRVLIFYRTRDRDPFTFAGIGTAVPHRSVERPARIDWIFGTQDSAETLLYTDEYQSEAGFSEGRRIQVYVNRYERDRRARDACVRHFGTRCPVCDIDFKER